MRTLIVAATLLAATASLAQTETTKPTEAPRVRYHPTTTLDFTPMNVEGLLSRPDTAYVRARTKKRFRNLIEVRSHFRVELLESADSL